MEKSSKLNEWLTLVANLAVVVGILLVVVQLRQNTRAIQAQTRDSISGKEMEVSAWIGTDSAVAGLFRRGGDSGYEGLSPSETTQYQLLVNGIFREWENSFYQHERGLFTADEFGARTARWEVSMTTPGVRDVWEVVRLTFAPDFRAEIDRIVAEAQ